MKKFLKILAKKYLSEHEQEQGRVYNEKYRKSGLTLEQAISIKNQIDIAFKSDRLYRDNDLGLLELADYIGHDRYKVSEVINKYYSMNFYALLNSYRINEAKELLVTKPFSSVKSVMYEVGFNSKNSFYNAFKKDTGLSPNSYRNLRAYTDSTPRQQLQFH
ncbi:helix-turn-helix domain-containing protein [Allomuricauda sp. SCSIO 65647]|uniref:helix-turn-helix domain-containing protein n=1 Tax=Allomuricauda sp. SCSIO 65647 TaxID=2908843 RepID=UPI001F25733C|nr:helix-turn-helix domain-containing protein [Muricauda sp. SCSIO 65647]UJH66496.1 helix-turn-helix domain-containing protein [Muricauda sp. SCSIO 65647]